ncbi:hypothetical protein ACQ4LE_000228 [Meloidogyne hapla]
MFLPILNKQLNSLSNNKYATILFLKRRTFSSSNNLNSSLLKKFDQYLAKKNPKVHTYYVMAMSGSKSCLSDSKIYFKLRKQIFMEERTFSDFSISELLIYLQTNENIAKMVSLLFVSFVVPLGLPLVILIMIFRPQLVLTRHFWTSQQTSHVQLNELRRIEKVNFPCILEQLSERNKNLSNQLPFKFYQLSSENVSLPKLEELSFLQLYHLKRLHKVSSFSIGAKSLMQHILILQLLDRKMAENKEKELKELNFNQLQLHLYIRKINYDKMDAESMQSFLNKWLQHCTTLPPSTYVYAPFLIQAKF